MKGVAATIETLIMTLLLLFFLVVFLTTVNNEMNKAVKMNFQESEILRLENTYVLLNDSLSATARISAVQSVFNATDQSLLCGMDDVELLGYDALPPKYWYQYDKANGAKNIPNTENFISNPDGNPKKYSGDEPSICYPNDRTAILILEKNYEKFKPRQESEVNDISIKFDNPKVFFNFTVTGMNISAEQDVRLQSINGKIEEKTKNYEEVRTDVPKMVFFGRLLVHKLTGLSDAFYSDELDNGSAYDAALKYHDVNNQLIYTPDANSQAYLTRISEKINGDVSSLESESGFERTHSSIEYSNLDLYASHTQEDTNVFSYVSSSNSVGLVLHYNISINLNEGGEGRSCVYPLEQDYQDLIQGSVAINNWNFNDIQYDNSEIVSLVSALMQRESSWNPSIASCAGAVGLGQLVPDTAKQLGLFVPDYETVTIFCDGRTWNAPSCNKLTPENCDASDERMIPEKNIMASVAYVNKLFEQMKSHTTDKLELIKFVLASYNAGPTRIENTISSYATDASNARYDEIEQHLPEETQAYVRALSSYYSCYGGVMPLSGNFYYFNDEKNNRFYQKPFSMQVKAEDYLPAIDCRDPSILPVRFFTWEKSSRYRSDAALWLGDMACCGGTLWSCNVNVPGMTTGALTSDGSAGGTCRQVLAQNSLSLTCENDGFNLISD